MGSWNQVTQVVVLNYPPETANGYLALYFEGELAMELKNVVFRTNESVTVSSLIFSSTPMPSDVSNFRVQA